MIPWLIRSTLLLTAFYAFFMLFMRRTTLFRLNRTVLLAGTAVCMLLPLLRFDGAKKKYFACASATAKCADFAAAAGIALLCADDVYELIKVAEKLPGKYLWEGKKRKKFLTLVRSRFTRKLCLPSFWSGAALLFFSYFTYYPVYYIAVGSALLLLCGAAAIFSGRKPA